MTSGYTVTSPPRVATGPGWELHLGKWQDVLSHVTHVDAVITDPPYSARTHEGWNDGEKQVRSATGHATRTALTYDAMTAEDMRQLCDHFMPRTRGWVCIMTSHDMQMAIEAHARAHDRYPFAPLPVLQKRPRLLGDGPSSWTVWMCTSLCVSRPRNREFATWGTLPGGYETPEEWCSVDAPHSDLPGRYDGPTVKNSSMVGCKPVTMMCSIVSDYSRPGALICDPYAGSGTTLIAAVRTGRQAIGAEADPDRFQLAVDRLRNVVRTAAGVQESLF